MGRLSALVALAGLAALAGCDRSPDAPRVGSERSQSVAAKTSGAPAERPAPRPSATAAPAARERLCAGQLERTPRAFPSSKLSRAAAPGARSVGATLEVGHGRWTWVNLWAAWCVPCKEEIPTLLRWRSELAGKLEFAFVSLDDDQRQLEGFLAAQPSGGLRASHWLEDGDERERWLEGSSVGRDPDLPVQLLLDPAGKLRCIIRGAIDASDLPELRRIVSG